MEVQFVMSYGLYKTRISGRCYSSTYNLLDLYTKLEPAPSTDINLLSLDETSRVAYYSGETQSSNNFFFYFSVAIDGRRNPHKRVARGGKL